MKKIINWAIFAFFAIGMVVSFTVNPVIETNSHDAFLYRLSMFSFFLILAVAMQMSQYALEAIVSYILL